MDSTTSTPFHRLGGKLPDRPFCQGRKVQHDAAIHLARAQGRQDGVDVFQAVEMVVLGARHPKAQLPVLVPRLQTRLVAHELTLRDFVADTGYSNGFHYAFLEQRAITPWIPVFGHYKPAAEGFT